MLRMQEMHQDTMRRLSVTQQSSGCWSEDKSVTEVISTRMAGEDAETDISPGDSVSVVPGNTMMSQMVQAQVQEEVAKLMASQTQATQKIEQQVLELIEKNRVLEQQAAISPSNGTPLSQRGNGKESTLDNCPAPSTPNSVLSHQGSKSARHQLQSLSGFESNDSVVKKGSRRSIAVEALTGSAPREDVPAADHGKQRKWWAEQRNFLMDDLYSMNMSPTPARNTRNSVGKALGPAFEQEAKEEVEWVVDCSKAEKSKSRRSVR